jgi:hypothetical protein
MDTLGFVEGLYFGALFVVVLLLLYMFIRKEDKK